ncbi:MAG: dimethylarginine dimethylaminohydrolase family protein [Candidatus Promineifilaceae bacterium]|jgi:dimethylargininase
MNKKEEDAINNEENVQEEEELELLDDNDDEEEDEEKVKAEVEEVEEVDDDEDDDDEDEEEEEPAVMEGKFTMAIVRMPSPTLADGLTTSGLGRADYTLFLTQHLSYTAVLRSLGLKILKLPSLPEFPDAHFIEDVAVITPEVAVITRPGAPERLGEIEHIRDVLRDLRPLAEIEEPGTLDGGDVMRIEQTVYVGISGRTNQAGAEQLAAILAPYDYETHIVPLAEGLHLKSSVNYIGRNTLLLTEAWYSHPLFAEFDKIIVPAEEAYTANTLLVKNRLLMPMGFPETQALLREAGFEILEIDATEMQKLDGGMSCMSLRF